MDRLQKAALLTLLVEALRDHGSWTGETHIQKATYFLQELLRVPLGFRFVLYWYGPFSFDLRDEMTALRGDDLLRIDPQPVPFGPRYSATVQAKYVHELYPKTLERYKDRIALLTGKLGSKGVASLERVATGYYVTRKQPGSSVEERVEELIRIKPHVSRADALNVIQEVDEIIEQAQALAPAE